MAVRLFPAEALEHQWRFSQSWIAVCMLRQGIFERQEERTPFSIPAYTLFQGPSTSTMHVFLFRMANG